MRHAVSSVFNIRQKLLKVTASQICKNYVFGCSAASALNSCLPVSLAIVAKVPIQLRVLQDAAKVDSGCQMFTLWTFGLRKDFQISQNENLDLIPAAKAFIFLSYIHKVNIWMTKHSHICLIFSLSEHLAVAHSAAPSCWFDWPSFEQSEVVQWLHKWKSSPLPKLSQILCGIWLCN